MVQKILLTLSLSCISIISFSQLQWPGISRQTKPWARWWWMGSAVNKKDITANMLDYQSAGLGGLELTPIYGVKEYENEFIDFLSPRWMQMLQYTLQEAKRLDLGIDMANGTGWPFGGPTITNEYASKKIEFKTYKVSPKEGVNEPIGFKQQGFVRTANGSKPNIQDINPVSVQNRNLQAIALDQVQFPGDLKLKLLMGYSDQGKVIDLTDKVGADGYLKWKADSDNWKLYALFEGLHGKMVERAAPGGEGYAIDHFSRAALDHYFKRFDTAFKGHDISYIRAFFNDSYEVDDAKGQSNWTPDLLPEFQQRRGYDLKQYLPGLFQQADSSTNKRVLFDYRTTIGELILEDFTQAWKQWGTTKNIIIRNQSHGSPGNLLDLYAAIDIPETEGDDILRYKFATSAAHVTGKQLASAETATWLNEHFLSSWGDVKKAVDLLLLSGVNHIFYHGVNYSPRNEAWPGWLFYAAVQFQQSNPQWKHFHALNDYVTRAQSFLQEGKPDNDVLVYYPLADRYMHPGKELLQHFDGIGIAFKGTDFESVSEWMQGNGYSFDFFSDKQLLKIETREKKLLSGTNQYQTILLPELNYIPLESMQQLIRLASEGATILVHKSLPVDVPGLSTLSVRQAQFKDLLSKLNFKDSGEIKKAFIGKGAFLLSANIDALLNAAGARQERMYEKGLQCIRRKNAGGQSYFIVNRSNHEVNEWINLPAKAATVAVYNLINGVSGIADWKEENGGIKVWIQLEPFESTILKVSNKKINGVNYPYQKIIGQPFNIDGEWTVNFIDGGPVLPPGFTTNKLQAWTKEAGDAYGNFSGTARYTTNFRMPGGNAGSYLLNLGQVNETAEVFLNDKKVATLIGPTFRVVFPATAFQTENKLEIIVANLMANRIAFMDRNKIGWKKFYNINMSARYPENSRNGVFDAAAWQPLPSGLSGPVTLSPVE